MRARIGTYNVLHGQPVLGREDPLPSNGGPGPSTPVGSAGGSSTRAPAGDCELRAAVAELDADVLGLQEVDVGQARSGHHHQVRSAARALGAEHWCFAPSVLGTPSAGRVRWERARTDHAQRSDSYGPMAGPAGPVSDADRSSAGVGGSPAGSGWPPLYGVGLVSRLPVLAWRTTLFDPAPFGLPLLVHAGDRARLMLVPDEPRAAIAAVVSGPGGPFTVATAHLSFVPGFNVLQLRRLRSWLSNLPRPLVVVGDLNLSGALPSRVTGWIALARAATYPVAGPRVQLDHVLADGLSASQAGAAHAEAHRLPVSDHCAVTVEVEL